MGNFKKYKLFRPKIRSRHPSHDILRSNLPKLPFRSVVRLGSTTILNNVDVECNSIEAIKNSASKLLMKKCFSKAGVSTANWYVANKKMDNGVLFYEGTDEFHSKTLSTKELNYPLIAKSFYGSRGIGNTKINSFEELLEFVKNKDVSNYIFEEYKTYLREYRIHVTEEGYFYSCRKMLKKDTPEHKKFQRHDDNCVWIVEENPLFDKPVNWDSIIEDCVKALKSLGLDIGAFDLKVQSAKDKKGNFRENPEWIIIESCSAPSFGKITSEKYIEQIPKILIKKFNK